MIRALADVVGGAGRATDAASSSRTRWPASRPRRPACPAASPSRTAARPASTDPTLAFARLSPPVDFGAKDGPADLAFLIAAPAGGDDTHLQLLTKLARALVKTEFTDALRAAQTRPRRSSTLVDGASSAPAPPPPRPPPPRGPGSHGPAGAPPRPPRRPPDGRSLVAVTACPTGIAHTYMAAEALEAAAERAGVDITVETQGSAGSTPARTRRSSPPPPR